MTKRDLGSPGNAAQSEPVIRVDGVSKWFGNVVAVSDISFDIRPGITGLLGPNGAGKTTLLRMMCGLASPSEGTITVFGNPARSDPSMYGRIGVMREHEAVYEFLTGRQFVEFSAKLRGVSDVAAAAAWAIDAVNLAPGRGKKDGRLFPRDAPTNQAGRVFRPQSRVAASRRTAQRRRSASTR